MILVDTSIWVDHFRSDDPVLTDLLMERRVLVHPFVIGELAMGNLRDRRERLRDLEDLPRALVADDAEALLLVDQQSLFGSGIGYIDAHLLAAARLTDDAFLWTRDSRLHAVAERLSLSASPWH